VIAALLFWVAVFMIYFTSRGTSPTEFLFGRLEPPPETLGTWQEMGHDPETRLLREERYLLPNGDLGSAYLLQQVRFRDAITRSIVRTDPERRVRRRRASSR
jgi:hypothetical protein